MLNGADPSLDRNRALFRDVLSEQADHRREEYLALHREQRRIAIKLKRIEESVKHLNGVLEDEGLPPIQLRHESEGGFAQPGNRSDGMPPRKPEWEGMTLMEIGSAILDNTTDVLHADKMLDMVYEIETPTEKKLAKRSFVSTLRSGAKKGLWEAQNRNRYQGLRARQQEMAGV